MKLTDFLREIDRPVAYYPKLSLITGGVKETIFLCQLLYWEGKQIDPGGWIYKTREEIWKETGLSRWEQETARENLKNKGFLEEKYDGMPRKLYYRLNFENINSAWETLLTPKSTPTPPACRRKNLQLAGGKTSSLQAEKPPTANSHNHPADNNLQPKTTPSENTTENTTENGRKEVCPSPELSTDLSTPEPRQMTPQEFGSLSREEQTQLVRQVARRMSRIFYDEYLKVFGSPPLNHEPSPGNGLLHPKLQKAAENFARNWILGKIRPREFRQRVRGALRREFPGVSPPGDIAQMWVVWNRCVKPADSGAFSPPRTPGVLADRREELPREEYTPRRGKGLAGIGELLQQYLKPVSGDAP